MDMDRIREYIRLRRTQREREAESAAVKEEADAIEQVLLEEFAVDGVQNMNVDGTTVYLQRMLWAQVDNAYDSGQVIERLRDAGLDHFVREGYSTQTLSSWLRDLEREEEPLPQALDGVIRPYERFSLRTRRS